MTRRSETGDPFQIGDLTLQPGERRTLRIHVARLPAGGSLALPLDVLHGARPGPRVFLSGGIHGDELDGVEITRQVLRRLSPETLAGTVIAAPIVNLPGLLTGSRYLPDRRDLNRSFPGAERGSLAARLAHLFMREVVERCTHGIDYHCGSGDRDNLPQVRANLDDGETERLAVAFGAPVAIHAAAPKGSLRRAAVERGVRVVLYEGGEARRFTRSAIAVGVAGTLRVLEALEMLHDGERIEAPAPAVEPVVSRETLWVRAGRSGICRLDVELGARVRRGEVLGELSDALESEVRAVKARTDGVVIGRRINPIAYQGEALVHLAVVQPQLGG